MQRTLVAILQVLVWNLYELERDLPGIVEDTLVTSSNLHMPAKSVSDSFANFPSNKVFGHPGVGGEVRDAPPSGLCWCLLLS